LPLAPPHERTELGCRGPVQGGVMPPPRESLTERLWAAYRSAPRPKPCAKELMEVSISPSRLRLRCCCSDCRSRAGVRVPQEGRAAALQAQEGRALGGRGRGRARRLRRPRHPRAAAAHLQEGGARHHPRHRLAAIVLDDARRVGAVAAAGRGGRRPRCAGVPPRRRPRDAPRHAHGAARQARCRLRHPCLRFPDRPGDGERHGLGRELRGDALLPRRPPQGPAEAGRHVLPDL